MSEYQPTERRFVVLESPYAGNESLHVEYAHAAMRDSLMRGEAPFASHLLYTQMLDDKDPVERMIGIEAGLSIGRLAVASVFYTDLGMSEGMKYGLRRAESEGRTVEFRSLNRLSQLRNH